VVGIEEVWCMKENSDGGEEKVVLQWENHKGEMIMSYEHD